MQIKTFVLRNISFCRRVSQKNIYIYNIFTYLYIIQSNASFKILTQCPLTFYLLTLSFSRSSLICWCSCSVSSWSPSRSYLAKMASISASECPFLQTHQPMFTQHTHQSWGFIIFRNISQAWFWSPSQVLPELIKVQFPSCLTKAIRDVIHRRLPQPQFHHGLVAALRKHTTFYAPLISLFIYFAKLSEKPLRLNLKM